MDVNNINIKDGDPTRLQGFVAPSKAELTKPKCEGINRKKRRRGKFKPKIMKPLGKVSWQEKRKNDKTKKNRFRKIVLAKTQAPFNNNQFLMEIHKPEPENSFDILQTPAARTRDSSFSIDSEENYFYSLPEDEEEYLTKEFSSVYEDAQSERLSNMTKNELIQEYLLLEAKYDNLLKRTERAKQKSNDDEVLTTDRETLATDKDSMIEDKDTSGTSNESRFEDELSYSNLLQRLKEQDEKLNELQLTNEKLRHENDHLNQRQQGSSSEDSESDSSSSSDSDSSSNGSVVVAPIEVCDDAITNEARVNGQNGESNNIEPPLVNGFHSPSEET